ncbi:hypothetical protein PBY51_016531 [Eleginops maclovinus]|uniref:Uncharacterized protein n=1 Tax=Eleginops maclovinus TaxID=56733 RepID=A0AAN8A9S7_ELEMC|nr:hypothetical protein PBY51_016531 [Eleginops maclovinus]
MGRDRLRDNVVQQRDLLKKHGVVVCPELPTNGEKGQEDDVSADSASRLAEEPSHCGRESMLGRDGKPGEVTDRKYNRSQVVKRSRSLARCVDEDLTIERTKPSNRDVFMLEMERSFDDEISESAKSYLGGSQVCVSIASPEAVVQSSTVSVLWITQEKPVPGYPSSDRDLQPDPSTAVECLFQQRENDGNKNQDVRCSEQEVVPDRKEFGAEECEIKEFCTPTFGDRSRENESAGGDGPRFEDGDPEALTNLIVEDEFVLTSQSPVNRKQSAGSLGSRETALKDEQDLSCPAVSAGPSLDHHSSDRDAFPAAEEAPAGGKYGTAEEPKDRGFNEGAPSDSLKSPTQMWRDWNCLENMIHSMLSCFVEQNPGFAAEISRIFPEIPESLDRWISDFEEMVKIVAENVSEQRDVVDQEPSRPMTGGSETTEDPEAAAGLQEILKESGLLGGHPEALDVSVDSKKIYEEDQDRPDLESPQNTSGSKPSISTSALDVSESSPEVPASEDLSPP